MASSFRFTLIYLLFMSLLVIQLNFSFGHDAHHSGSHHHCDHGHHHHDDHQKVGEKNKLPEELAEEEDLKMYGFGDVSHYTHEHHEHHHHEHGGAADLSGLGLWIHAMGCSLLVSLASLICLIILPVIFIQGKPSKAMVDSLAVFGAGAMLGDAFLHQLPHAFGGEHSHSHSHDEPNAHHHDHLEHSPSHSHSLQDLSVGLSILAGIVLFLFVEKVVRYVDEMSGGVHHGHHHHHHHHKSIKELKDDDDDVHDDKPSNEAGESISSNEKVMGEQEHGDGTAVLRKRTTSASTGEDKPNLNAANDSTIKSKSVVEKEQGQSSSNLVFGYLNLFSDGVHNFTDGMALGSAFLLYGSVGGWSRTLFLLAHELPQEIGDFGILVRSGFSVSKALFFNFLSALVALAGTALALMWGQDPGQSSLIEGFTAGGFIYIAVAGVLAEMNNGSSSIRSTATQLTSLILGMSVALCISLLE